jgi:ABC-2 type transport system ATP-binding protein
VHSSHLVADLERVCDYVIVLAAARVQVAGDVAGLLARHRLLTGPRCDPAAYPPGVRVISARSAGSRTTLLVRDDGPAGAGPPGWTPGPVRLEDLVLAYMNAPAGTGSAGTGSGHADSARPQTLGVHP